MVTCLRCEKATSEGLRAVRGSGQPAGRTHRGDRSGRTVLLYGQPLIVLVADETATLRIAELSTATFCTFRASCRHRGGRLTSAATRNVLERLSGVNEPPIIIRMMTTGSRSSSTTTGFGISSNARGT